MLTGVTSAIIRGPAFKGKQRLLKLLLKIADGGVVRSRYGVLMRIRSTDYTNRACITGSNQRDYDDVFAQVIQLRPGMVFLDIGANAGLFSLVAGGRVGHAGAVLAFEPNPHVFTDLADNVTLNDLVNVSLFNAAVGERSGRLRFTSGLSEHTGAGRLDEHGSDEVTVMSFADNQQLIELIGDRRVVAKIDVEGAEAQVLKGMSPLFAANRVDTLIVEIDDALLRRQGASAEEIYTLLSSSGFTPERGRGAAAHYNEIFKRMI